MKIGYARVSTRKQKLDLQVRALQEAGCDMIVAEKIGGRSRNRPGLAAAIALARSGDELIAWKLDRLGRDLVQLVELLRVLRQAEVSVSILSGQAASIDIDTAEGRALYGIFASFADLEHQLGAQRASAGLKNANERGGALRRSRARPALLRRPLTHVFKACLD